jgi:hypothetical protein
MIIPPEVEAQILRLHHVEKWRRGTIARQLPRAPWHRDPGADPSRPRTDLCHRRRRTTLPLRRLDRDMPLDYS